MTIAGAYIKGAPLQEAGAKWTQKVAGAGYKQVPPPAGAGMRAAHRIVLL